MRVRVIVVGMTTHTLQTPAEKFEAFHRMNPGVYALLVALTRQYVQETGHRKVGFSLVYGAARWQWAIQTRDEASEQKLNNNYAPFYARMIMGRVQDLAEVYDLRTSVADDWAAEHFYPVALGWYADEDAA
jgi:hypothetical protein